MWALEEQASINVRVHLPESVHTCTCVGLMWVSCGHTLRVIWKGKCVTILSMCFLPYSCACLCNWVGLWPGEMAQWIKYLLHNRGDMSSDAKSIWKSWVWLYVPAVPVLRGRDGWMPGDCYPLSVINLGQTMSQKSKIDGEWFNILCQPLDSMCTQEGVCSFTDHIVHTCTHIKSFYLIIQMGCLYRNNHLL